MPEFTFDVKAYCSVRVTAATEDEAKRIAVDAVRSTEPDDAFWDGYNTVLKTQTAGGEMRSLGIDADPSEAELLEIDGEPVG